VPLDSRASITVGNQKFEVDATDLQPIETLGSGAYGVVEKMRHRQSDTVMAVKVWICIPNCILHRYMLLWYAGHTVSSEPRFLKIPCCEVNVYLSDLGQKVKVNCAWMLSIYHFNS
jgi:hypothetical protein